MGFNRENYRRIKREYEGKALRAAEAAEQRKLLLHGALPVLKKIDEELSMTGLRIFEATLRYKGEALEREIASLRRENEALQKKRAELLVQNGYAPDFTNVKYECEDCSDSGFVGLTMCHCMKEKLILAGYESSGIGALIRRKTFDSYDPRLQKGNEQAYENAVMVHGFCRGYAERFDLSSPNLLLLGPTGLGKTHLSTAIAKDVIGRGYDVVCETAQNVFADFEYERFGRPYGKDEGEEKRTDRYFDCDLLILDDLGAEMTNQFTVSCLYNILNTRINRGAPILINTNLTRDELKKRYADRVTSRLFGEFLPIVFVGRDARELRLS